MESISRIASELPLLSKGVVTGDKQLPSSVHAVEFNDDLLLEILLRLPVISLSRFRYVSKRWLSLIIDPHFTLHGIQNNNLYPPSAQILWRYKVCFGYDFLPLDSRILSSGSRFQTISKFGSVTTKFKILQSCNGLLLCRSSSHDKLYYYVCNPSIHLFTMLPQPHIPHLTLDTFYGGVKLAFDPTKSPHYKVIHARPIYGDDIDDDDYIQIQTYFSGTRNWIILCGLFPCKDFECFHNGIYWNGAIHWLKDVNMLPLHSKLDIVDHPVLTTMLLKLPLTSNRLVLCNVKLFESCGCLLLLYWDNTQPRQMNIYEMRNGHSEWSVKYLVNLNDILKLFPKTWSICPTVCCIALGEREEDSFMVMQLFGKLVQYKFVLKTVHTLCDLGSASLHERLTVMASFAGV